LLANDCHLHSLFAYRTSEEGAKTEEDLNISKILQSNTWISRLQKAIDILQPVCELITAFEGNTRELSEIHHSFYSLIAHYSAAPLTQADKQTILSEIKSRHQFISSPAHDYAYMLDPRYMGEYIPSKHRDECMAQILKIDP